MRDKHISAISGMVRQTGSETTTYTGRQQFSDTQSIPGRQMTTEHKGTTPALTARLFCRLLLALILLLVFSQPVSALNQIQNGSFTANLNGWYVSPAVVTGGTFVLANDTTGFQTPNSARARYVKDNSGSNNYYYPAQIYIQQSFLTSTRSTNVNARFTSAHMEDAPSNTEWKIKHNGTIRKAGAQEVVVGTFYDEQHDATATLHLAWPASPTVWETELEANTSYVARIYFDFASWKGNTTTAWVDYITCNVSPAGLIASETTDPVSGSARGKCQLNWDASTWPATGTPGIHLTAPYRLYRSYISSTGPWTQIATLPTGVANYLDSPTADIAWYAVSDVDVTGEESPLSLPATYRSAQLVITKVETTTTNVTKGQNGLPVKVYVTNPGLASATLNTVELLFETPTSGIYSIGAPSPLPPLTFAPGQTTIFTFLVAVASGSDSGIDYIDARVTGSNTQTLANLLDNGADIKASWLIQEPPNLKLIDIQASSTVYLDQTGVGIYLTVRNDGEAAALWDLWNNTEIQFSLGTYLNLRPFGVVNPYSEVIYTGQTTTIRYDVDISPYSATGTSSINASMTYVDGNTYNTFSYDSGDPTPPSWTIRSGILKTYRGPAQFPAYVLESDSFNLGNFTVYAKGLNLQPDKDFRLRWYPPTGSQINQMVSTNMEGILFGSHTIGGDPSRLGRWRVIVSRATNEIPLCETYFDVVDAASLSATITLPSYVTINQPFVATMTFINYGGSRIDTASAAALINHPGNTGTATYNSGPIPSLSTVDPHSTTDKTWNYTASSIGSFTVEGKAYGIDANDLRILTTASITSNMCIIQSPAVLSITSVYASETAVFRNQQNLIVDVGVNNTGSASALIKSAQLNFSRGTHYQTLTSPALDYTLVAGTPASLRFMVSISPTSATGAVTITASFTAVDANWLASTPVTVHSTPFSDTWTISAFAGFCSANNAFSPEQYTFNSSQRVYTKFSGMPVNSDYRVVFLPAADTANKDTLNLGTINSGPTAPGFVVSDYVLPVDAAGSWKTELWTVSGKNLAVHQARQFFEVQRPGSITASLNFVPDDIKLNDEVTLQMSLSNSIASGSTISNIVPSLPLKYTGSTGELSLLTGPTPASVDLPAGAAATLTWTYISTTHSGSGTYRIIASATGNDANLPTLDPGYLNTVELVSNQLYIRYRDLAYASASIDFGNMVCGESRTIGSSRVNNLGSTDLVRTSWYKGFYESNLLNTIHPNNLTLYPLSPFTVSSNPAASFTTTYAVMTLPYNQPAENYIATITVFEDMYPFNGVLDAGEPAKQFNSTVTASSCRVIYLQPSTLSLGDWKIGNWVATQSVTIHNGGNLALSNLKIIKDTATTFTMYSSISGTGALATDATRIASISAYVSAGSVDGDYNVYFTVWDDSVVINDAVDPGEASATLHVRIGIGTQLMHFTPDLIDFGCGTPTVPLPEMSFAITNIGDKTLDRLSYISNHLYHVASPGIYISADEIELSLPDSITVNATKTAYVNMFVPAGTAVGTYTGQLIVFEDEDGDGTYIGDDNEAPASLTIQVYVLPFRGLRVLSPVADTGPLSPTETGFAQFAAKNTGNVVLDNLTWLEIPLSAGTASMSTATYFFEPVPFFSQPFNTIFNASMTLTVPPGQAHGEYTGEFAWLLDSMGVASDPKSPFTVSCQVGTKYVDITEPSLLIVDAMPSILSAAASFEIKNTGTLMLIHPVATATAFTGPAVIPATASIFIPSTFDFMIANKTFNGLWQVQVPAGTPVGTYNATMTVWNDTNYNNQIESGEASDTAALELRVIAKTVIGISPTSLEFGYVAPERSAAVNFSIVNLGNQNITATDLRAVASWLPPLAPGPVPIPAVNLVFPTSFATNLPIGESVPAVATITIPAGQSTVTYRGTQRIYVDSDAPNGSYTDGEVTATFSARVSVGNKQISVNDVDMGSHAHNTTATTSFTLSNTGDINVSRIRWIPQNVSNGTATLTTTLSSAGTSVVASGTLNCSANVVIPQYTPPGIYTAIQTVFDDDLPPFDNILNPSKEASDTFLLTLTVATSPGLIITDVDPAFPVNLALGQKVFVNVTYQNTGNVALSDLSWGAPMATMNGSEGDTMVPTFAPTPLPSLAPGATYIASITFEARPDQATGTYTGVQTLSSTAHPAATANIAPDVLVVAQTGPKDLGPGTVYQNIATETFSAAGDFIFSAYVGFEDGVPASATIAFRQDKDDDTPATPMFYVAIDQSGNILSENPVGSGGVVSRIKSGNKTWYRLFIKFSGALNALTEGTYLILSNSSDNVGTDVWFDGVQLEKANGRDRPTSYGEGLKIISPNNRIDLEGKARYSDW